MATLSQSIDIAQNIYNINFGLEKAEKKQSKFKQAIEKTNNNAINLSSSIKSIVKYINSMDLVKKFIGDTDEYQQVQARINSIIITHLQPVLNRFSEFLNSNEGQQFFDSISNGILLVILLAERLMNVVLNIASYFQENWSWIAPIILGIAAAVLLYQIAATASAIAQSAFNRALFSCPITWIILAIITLITLFVIFTEEIMGAIYWIGALGKNIGLWFANIGIGIWESLKACIENVKITFTNAWLTIQQGFLAYITVVLCLIKKVIDLINKIPGISIDTSAFEDSIKYTTTKIMEIENSKGDYKSVSKAWKNGFSTNDAFKDGWGKEGYSKGEAVGANISAWMDDNLSINSILEKNGLENESLVAEYPYDELGTQANPSHTQIDAVNDTVDVTSEDLKVMRELAEMKAVQNYVTLTPTVDVKTGDLHKEVDVDEVVNKIANSLETEIAASTKAVYSIG